MPIKLVRANLTYQSFYKKPLLERPEGKASLTQQIFDALSENFPISVTDIGANSSHLPSEAFVNFRLFSGTALIELRADHWRGYFPAIMTREDVEQVTRCLNVVAPVMAATSDRLMPAKANVVIATWFSVDEQLDFGAQLNGLWSDDSQLLPSVLGAERIALTFNPTLRNASEGWDATFVVQPSAVEGSQIFLNLHVEYLTGGTYGSLDDQLQHSRKLVEGMLKHFGHDVSEDEATHV